MSTYIPPPRIAPLGLVVRFVASLAALCVCANLFAAPPYHRADKPIVDDQGRKRIIIDFVDNAHEAFPRELLAQFNPKTSAQQPQVVALVEQYERLLGFKRVLMTTWVGNSVTAFLNSAQIEQLKLDPKIKLLTEDAYMQYSALWSANWNGNAWGERNDWGRVAVSGKSVADLPGGGTGRKVYIIDSGVADHDDLGSVIQRVNVACGNGGDCSGLSAPIGYPNPVGYYPTVGCFAHSTHVAGIVGATYNNGKNRAGVLAGVPIVSVALNTTQGMDPNTGTWIPCAYGPPTVSGIGAAFDYIYFQNRPVAQSVTSGPNIATMSINPGQVGFAADGSEQTNRSKLLTMVTPGNFWSYNYSQNTWIQLYYDGIFFVQSAGNQNQPSCAPLNGASLAYQTSFGATSTANDGIMVVGAITDEGTAASGTLPQGQSSWFQATQPPGLGDPSFGSNYGTCVDIWAPGNFIYSTWGKGVDATRGSPASYSGGQPSDYPPRLPSTI